MMKSPGLRITRHQGLTLIELLIAMAIFAVMTASMFVAFDSFQKGKELTEANSERLKRYQLAFNIATRDFQQMLPRPVRDEYGSEVPLFGMRSQTGAEVEFTRAGWNRSPFSKVVRSELQRVVYYLEDGKLMRGSWSVLDRAEDSVPNRTELLDRVENLSFIFYYLDKQGKLAESANWPPDNLMSDPQANAGIVPERQLLLLPRIVEIRVNTEDMGNLTRKFLIANCFVDVYHPAAQGGAPLGGGCGS